VQAPAADVDQFTGRRVSPSVSRFTQLLVCGAGDAEDR
jgi:hypothetical protein